MRWIETFHRWEQSQPWDLPNIMTMLISIPERISWFFKVISHWEYIHRSIFHISVSHLIGVHKKVLLNKNIWSIILRWIPLIVNPPFRTHSWISAQCVGLPPVAFRMHRVGGNQFLELAPCCTLLCTMYMYMHFAKKPENIKKKQHFHPDQSWMLFI